jgi:hypothetical protein
VHRLAYNGDVVAFKMAAGKAVRAGLAVGGRISKLIRNRRATQPPAHFQRNPLGAASWLFFRVARSARINPGMGTSLVP